MNKKIKLILVALLILMVALLVYTFIATNKKNIIGFSPDSVAVIFNSATSSSVVGGIVNVKDYSSAVCSVDWDVNPTSTVKFVGSIQSSAPNFKAAQSSTNQFEYLSFTDMRTGSVVAGTTGVSASTTADHKMVLLNASNISWISAIINTSSAITTTGRVSVNCIKSNAR